MAKSASTAESNASYRHTLNAYMTGFLLSIALTICSYLLVEAHLGSGYTILSHPFIVVAILVFAVVQLVVQMLFFLHLGEEKKPRWRLLTVVLASIFVLIVVVGSIWIMANLNYRMTPHDINEYMRNQAGSGL